MLTTKLQAMWNERKIHLNKVWYSQCLILELFAIVLWAHTNYSASVCLFVCDKNPYCRWRSCLWNYEFYTFQKVVNQNGICKSSWANYHLSLSRCIFAVFFPHRTKIRCSTYPHGSLVHVIQHTYFFHIFTQEKGNVWEFLRKLEASLPLVNWMTITSQITNQSFQKQVKPIQKEVV